LLKVCKGKPDTGEGFCRTEGGWRICRKIEMSGCKHKCTERILCYSKSVGVLAEKLMGKFKCIMPVENSEISKVRAMISLIVVTGNTLLEFNCAYICLL